MFSSVRHHHGHRHHQEKRHNPPGPTVAGHDEIIDDAREHESNERASESFSPARMSAQQDDHDNFRNKDRQDKDGGNNQPPRQAYF